jgi:hypothetical protein
MKLLTFLGTGKYEETIYVLGEHGEREQGARYAPVASCAFLQPSELIVFATEDAESAHGNALRSSVTVPVTFVPIPLGKDERELWQIFASIAANVRPRDEVAFDITHGLRSSPLLGLFAAAFLRAGLEVNVRAILYGAYDVGKIISPGKTPMFDLSPMLGLLEWASAADRFNRTGDARYLATLVEKQRKTLACAAQGDHAALEQAGALGNLASTLSKISEGLRLIRPHQVMDQVAGLSERVERARPALERAATAQPFQLLLDRVIETYQPLASPSSTEPHVRLRQTLEIERRLIHWYAERELWVQAISLAREWLVSWVMFHLGIVNITQRNLREHVSNVLGSEADNLVNARHEPIFLASLPNRDQVLKLWKPLTDARNDVLHAGMRDDPRKPEDLIKQIREHIETLDTLAL